MHPKVVHAYSFFEFSRSCVFEEFGRVVLAMLKIENKRLDRLKRGNFRGYRVENFQGRKRAVRGSKSSSFFRFSGVSKLCCIDFGSVGRLMVFSALKRRRSFFSFFLHFSFLLERIDESSMTV